MVRMREGEAGLFFSKPTVSFTVADQLYLGFVAVYTPILSSDRLMNPVSVPIGIHPDQVTRRKYSTFSIRPSYLSDIFRPTNHTHSQ